MTALIAALHQWWMHGWRSLRQTIAEAWQEADDGDVSGWGTPSRASDTLDALVAELLRGGQLLEVGRQSLDDLLAFDTSERFTVILFRETFRHVPSDQIPAVFDHYARFLTPEGHFVVRAWHVPPETLRAITERGRAMTHRGGAVVVVGPPFTCR